jgi:methionine sulfoxide reductase heme-binding subunit
MTQRLKKHYFPLLSFVIIASIVFYIYRGRRDSITFIADATGYISLVILAVSLIIGPVNLILKYNNPVSTYLRRDISITGGVLAVIHSVTGLFVHLRGKMWLYFFNDADHGSTIRLDHFGLANYTGLFAAIVILLLLITSNDYLLKKLTTLRWKKIQRLSYVVFFLIAVHCYFYRIGNDNHSVFLWFYSPLFTSVLILQIIGIYLNLSSRFSH